MARPTTDDDREQVRTPHTEREPPRDRPDDQAVTLDHFQDRRRVRPSLIFDRAAEVAVVTEVRRADLAARRADPALGLQDDAEQLRAQLFAPCTVGESVGRDGEWHEADLDRPRFGDQRQIIGAVQTAVNTSLRLAPAEGGEGVDGRLYACGEWRHEACASHRSMTDAQYSAAVREGLLTELPGYSWDPKATDCGEDAPLKVDGHSADAPRYAVHSTAHAWRHLLTSTNETSVP
ncbi:hypothetical protein [Streptomyces antimycoticus]|uniref:hypothetical protein n=1 Tax=Streptomyces antimycoticus TaxID=68175 RepID=UPI00368CC7A7